MSTGGLTIVDGKHLAAVDLSVPELEGNVTGAQLLKLAESRASSSLFRLSLPENLKSSALKRLNYGDPICFQSRELDRDQASSFLKDYVSAIADVLKEDPLAIAILDGNTLRLFLGDEDDFAMLAENLFTDLDIEDKGKINKSEIQNALVHMGVELGVPPFSVLTSMSSFENVVARLVPLQTPSPFREVLVTKGIDEFPLLNNILQKHGADGSQELGQSQFAQLLQPVLQDLADALSERPVAVIQNIKIVNGSRIRNLLACEEKLNVVEEKILQQEKESKEDRQRITAIIRVFLEENEKELGLPSSKADESVALLYEAVFTDVESTKIAAGLEEDNIRLLLKDILEKFAQQLEANPVFQEIDG